MDASINPFIDEVRDRKDKISRFLDEEFIKFIYWNMRWLGINCLEIYAYLVIHNSLERVPGQIPITSAQKFRDKIFPKNNEDFKFASSSYKTLFTNKEKGYVATLLKNDLLEWKKQGKSKVLKLKYPRFISYVRVSNPPESWGDYPDEFAFKLRSFMKRVKSFTPFDLKDLN